jgi:predicted lipoprotein
MIVAIKKYQLAVLASLAISAVVLHACSKNKGSDEGNTGTDDFKKSMLVNYADNIIIPAYTDLNTKLNSLEVAVNAFLAAPSIATQTAVKAPFKNAYLSFEKVSVAYIGPASALLLNNYMNTFPCATSKIEAGIASGSYNFTQPVVSDSIQGLPALDYLLFANNTVEKFTSAGNIDNRKKYVRDVIARMKTLANDVTAQWNSGYRSTFVNSLKTDVGSSIGFLVNQFAFEMDALKGPRIGWPFGKQSNGIVFADKCEAYYSGFSAELAVANLTSLKNYYTGAAGDGIDDYLVLLKKDQLNKDVLAQFDVTLNALKAIPDPMSAAFTSNAALVEEAYKQIQKLLTLIKTDVASATGVQITYMDNDGD